MNERGGGDQDFTKVSTLGNLLTLECVSFRLSEGLLYSCFVSHGNHAFLYHFSQL